VGETRVDLLHLLEDLRDAYPGSLEETIVSEVVANALDSGARTAAFLADPAAGTLTVTDDGSGMARRQLARYHDLAHTTKVRGAGIGFAGVGMKLGLLACEEVLTETRRGKSHVASLWRLASRHRAPWKWVPPLGLVAERGTAVRLTLANPLSPLLDPGFLETVIRRHFEPLLDPVFGEILTPRYPQGARFTLNGRPLERIARDDRTPLAIRFGRRRKPGALGWLARHPAPLPEEERGVAVSTLGKVIKRGWDWLGVTPADPERVSGLIEVPALAECLTLNKADFIRTGSRGALYLAHRKGIQQAVAAQLAEWGADRDTESEARDRKLRPVERDLEAVLADLADEFPLLSTLVERHRGGQRRLPMGRVGEAGLAPAVPVIPGAETAAADTDEAPTDTGVGAGPAPAPPGEATADTQPSLPGPRGPRRPGRYGLSIRFESLSDSEELSRLVESTVWINDAHPAWRRAVASRSEGYHLALGVAMALAPLAVEPPGVHGFVNRFLARWGEAASRRRR
jgi:hypothetical protein